MSLRIANGVIMLVVTVAASVCCPGAARAQQTLPLELASLEWVVADSAVVVRGVVVEVAVDARWNIVTLDVHEMLKGAATARLRFAAHRFAKGDAGLAWAKQSKRELLWLLKRHDAGAGDAPGREQVLARHRVNLYAPFVAGRPGQPALPVVPLGAPQAGQALQPPAFLGLDLRVRKTADELVQAIRTAIAETPDQQPVRSYAVTLPQDIAQRTGFSHAANLNQLIVPVDRRLEAFARRLVQSPGDFIASNDRGQKHLLRLEGVRALRLLPSEQNLAIVRAWLTDPASTEPFPTERKSQSADLVPARPRPSSPAKLALPVKLADVAEIHFQEPLTKAMTTEDAQLHTTVTIDSVEFLNRRKTDAFIETLLRQRPDLAGLSFAMGDSCRMKPEAGKQFVAALEVVRTPISVLANGNQSPTVAEHYQEKASLRKIEPSASIAALMQVLAPEDATARLGLAKYLASLKRPEATHALAKLAIFSEEAEIRTAAVAALKKRDAKDYTALLLAGLQYPWPAVAERSSQAIVELVRKELIPQLIAVLEQPDPRAPRVQPKRDKKVSVVRELVRVNHHHNCLLCHAPAPRAEAAKEPTAPVEGLTAPIPLPSEAMTGYFPSNNRDLLVRIDVTYLRQDFSMKLPVANAEPWPALQRYDFLVRTRAVTEPEARALQQLLQPSEANGISPYHRAAVSALRALTGLEAAPTATAWRKLTGL